MSLLGVGAPPTHIIGAELPMPDAVDRVVGTIRFTVDHAVEGMAHGRLVRSHYPHAEIISVHAEEALGMPGVLAVLTGDDLSQSPEVPNPRFGLARRDQAPLAIGKVRYAGDPVVLVVADTDANARRAAESVMVDYEELPYVVDPLEAIAPGAPVIHDEWPDNECGTWALDTGDVDSAMESAAHVFDSEYISPAANAVPFESLVAIAKWDEGGLEIWSATQWPSAVQKELAHVFDVDASQVRVHVFPLGGGFGAKSQVKIEPLVAAAARLVERPVRLELDRDEMFLSTVKHAARIRIRTGVDSDGNFLARDIDLLYNGGAYAVLTPNAVAQGLLRSPGPYRIPSVRIRSRGVYTNTVPSGSFRGAMTNQSAFAYESHLDEIAAGIGIDPVALRLQNVLQDGDTYPTGQVMHDVHFSELVENVADAIGWDVAPPPLSPNMARGKGVGVILKTAPPGTASEVRLELDTEGRVTVYSSSVDMGQGAKGTLAQLAAHHLGVRFEDVAVADPDTSSTGFDSLTGGSRTTYVGDLAIRQASSTLLEKLGDAAADQLHLPADGVGHESGFVVSLADPSMRKGYAEIVRDSGLPLFAADGRYESERSTALLDPLDVKGDVSVHWHQGAVAVEVEVDLETGRVQILRSHGAAWAGRVINPTRARQQSEGSIIYGIGPALFEETLVMDGQVVNPNLSDYMIPSFLDVPLDLTSSSLEDLADNAEIHGVGEMTIPAVAPAIANAVARAVGARVREMPITAERVLRALPDRDPEPTR